MSALMNEIVELCEANPGALNVLCSIAKTRPQDAPQCFSAIREHELTGSKLWIAYKYICDQNYDQLVGGLLLAPERLAEQVEDRLHLVITGEERSR